METATEVRKSWVFRSPRSGKEIDISLAWLWTLLFGPFYFLWHNNYVHAAILFGIFLLPFLFLKDIAALAGLDTFFEVSRLVVGAVILVIYSILAREIMSKHFKREGWTHCE